MLLFYIRHGDPIYHPDSLTELGKRQAEALARRLCLYGLDRIYSSTSTRALLTAEPTAQILKKEITQLDWCHEHLAFQDLSVRREGCAAKWIFHDETTRAAMVSEEAVALVHQWWKHPELSDPRYRSGWERIRRESLDFLAEHGYVFDPASGTYTAEYENDQRIALFAHQGFGTAFMSAVLNIPYPLYCTHFDMGHSGVTVIQFPAKTGPVIPTVLTLSNDSHIYRDGLPTWYQNKIRF